MVGTRAAMMMKFFAGIIIILMLLHTRGSDSTRPLVRFSKVLTSRQRVDSSPEQETLQLPNSVNPVLHCSQVCAVRPWCQLSCLSLSNTECILSNIIVMANYNESNLDDALQCLTRFSEDLATGASITGVVGSIAAKNPENLVDGIYCYIVSECFQSDRNDNWFLIDLGENRTIQRIRLLPLPTSWAWTTAEYDVRVGTSVVNDPPTGFANYKEFGFFPGPATASQDIIMEVPQPVTARFVSFEKQVNDGHSVHICHVEIY